MEGEVLKGFTALRRLDVDAGSLLGPQAGGEAMLWWEAQGGFLGQMLRECVPVCLEMLVLRGCAKGVLDQVRAFIGERGVGGEEWKRLKEVEVVLLRPREDIGGNRSGKREVMIEEEVVDVISGVTLRSSYLA